MALLHWTWSFSQKPCSPSATKTRPCIPSSNILMDKTLSLEMWFWYIGYICIGDFQPHGFRQLWRESLFTICRSPVMKYMITFHFCGKINLEKCKFKIQLYNTCIPFHSKHYWKSWPVVSWDENHMCYFGKPDFMVKLKQNVCTLVLGHNPVSCNLSDHCRFGTLLFSTSIRQTQGPSHYIQTY